ncbi:prepilin-type N-terminal cleavage/methylation domain-containing protein [Paenibacillus psychroresistens]|uniref:Prepilin-type N-terminal cleavage/methylation domain-containing protein n=1 Tax=Paenibacillus psychroresistens TaxID=1778678 RepID=A0A6B8RMU1_9BACL|nr:prepilin-type N-terminal cleavage/methylation domain-containing protein [Paenibacillus psychroresistens]QGQ96696.1 prepilin-type N-terminal cleavage/methylation domain-containing protein [Paenibacillus psychroresistens]
MNSRHEKEGGFSLIEVLASIVILSIASLTMTAFFNSAMTYNKGNQNKTVMVNIARNVLVYMEKQDFVKMKGYFVNNPIPDKMSLSYTDCNHTQCGTPEFQKLFINSSSLVEVLNPVVNNIPYHVTIEYQPDNVNPDLNKYLLPIVVKVSNIDPIQSNHRSSEVEGYITSGDIR